MIFGLYSPLVFSNDELRGLKRLPDTVEKSGGEVEKENRGLKRVQKDEGDIESLAPKKIEKILPVVNIDSVSSKKLSLMGRIYVKKINVNGNTILSLFDLVNLTTPYTDRYVSVEELHQLRNQLNKLYVSAGYINSGVTIPDQRVNNGVINYKAIEGAVTGIKIIGNNQLESNYVSERLLSRSNKVMNIKSIQDDIKLLQSSSLIDRVNAKLEPGQSLGESVLTIGIKEADANHFTVLFDNHRPPSVGSDRLGVNYQSDNTNGMGNQFSLNIGSSEGVSDYALSYSKNLNRSDDALIISLSKNNSIVVEEPFNAIDLKSESYSVGVLYKININKTLSSIHSLNFGFDNKNSTNSVLGVPIAFDPGADSITGESIVTALSISYDYIEKKREFFQAYKFSYRQGLDAFQSTIHTTSLPDSDFSVLNAQLQYAWKYSKTGSQLLFKTSMQSTSDSLLNIEKFAFGGASSVRGYRENQFIRDTGYLMSFEWFIPVMATFGSKNDFKLVPFFDAGLGEDNDEAVTQTVKQSISSVGVGLVWESYKAFKIELYIAEALDDVPVPVTENLQDSGVHFSMVYNAQF